MKARSTGIVLGLMLLIPGTPLQALDLYTGEVPVADQSTQARASAMGEALAQVLVKVTGDPSAPDAQGIDSYLGTASRYAQQFQYRTERRPPEDEEEEPERVLLLSARFDPSAVERMLREAGLPRWGQERPTVLVWLVRDTGGKREFVGLDDPVLSGAVERAARQRGLPVLFPLLDLADQQAVQPRELWGGFTESLADASERYGTSTFLLTRLGGSEEDWRARWTLYDRGRESHFETGGEEPAEVLEAGVGRAATLLGERFAVAVTEQSSSRVTVAVRGVRAVADFDRVLDYFRGLTIVNNVQPEAAEGDQLTLSLQLSAGLERLDQVISLGQVLARVEDAPVAVTGGPAHHRYYDLDR